MATVKFAHTCDCCGDRSEEYSPWLICYECGNDVCPECATDIREPDEDRGSGLCLACSDRAAEERYWDQKIHLRMDGDEC